jgi:hypothetical protein
LGAALAATSVDKGAGSAFGLKGGAGAVAVFVAAPLEHGLGQTVPGG